MGTSSGVTFGREKRNMEGANALTVYREDTEWMREKQCAEQPYPCESQK